MVLELESEPLAARRAREAIAEIEQLVPRRCFDDLRVVVSELVTNSVVHGPGSPIRLRVEIDEAGNVVGEVEDDGEGAVVAREARLLDGAGGLGLELVDSLTERWGVRAGSTDVWFELTA